MEGLQKMEQIERLIGDIVWLYIRYSSVYIGEINLSNWTYRPIYDITTITTTSPNGLVSGLREYIGEGIRSAVNFLKNGRGFNKPLRWVSPEVKLYIWIYFPKLILSRNLKVYFLDRLGQLFKEFWKRNCSGLERNTHPELSNFLDCWGRFIDSQLIKETLITGVDRYKLSIIGNVGIDIEWLRNNLEVRILIPSTKLNFNPQNGEINGLGKFVTFEGRAVPEYCKVTGDRKYLQPPLNMFKTFAKELLLELVGRADESSSNSSGSSKSPPTPIDLNTLTKQIWGVVRIKLDRILSNPDNRGGTIDISESNLNQDIYRIVYSHIERLKSKVQLVGRDVQPSGLTTLITKLNQLYGFFKVSYTQPPKLQELQRDLENRVVEIEFNLIEGGFDVISLAYLSQLIYSDVEKFWKIIALVSTAGLSKTQTYLTTQFLGDYTTLVRKFFKGLPPSEVKLKLNLIFDNDVNVLPFKLLKEFQSSSFFQNPLVGTDKNLIRLLERLKVLLRTLVLELTEYLSGLENNGQSTPIPTQHNTNRSKESLRHLFRIYKILLELRELVSTPKSRSDGSSSSSSDIVGSPRLVEFVKEILSRLDTNSIKLLEILRLSKEIGSSGGKNKWAVPPTFWEELRKNITFHRQLFKTLSITREVVGRIFNPISEQADLDISVINVMDYSLVKELGVINFEGQKFKDFNDLWILLSQKQG